MAKIKMMYVHSYIDRNGHVRHYFRKNGRPKITLPGTPGSPEFMQAYQAALGGTDPSAKKHPVESFAGIVTRYCASPRFTNLSASSKAQYRAVLSRHLDEDGHRDVRELTPEDAERIITEIATTRGPGIANLNRSVLSSVYRYAVKLRIRKDNPFSVDVIERYELGSHHTWTDAEIHAYREFWPVGTRERLILAVLLYSGQRVSDAVKLKRTVDYFTIKQQKTGAELTIPVHPAIKRAAKAMPSNSIYLVCDKDGRPLRSDTLTYLVREAVRKAGLPPRCKAHGLRKASLRLLAEHQATTKQIQSISGHKTLREVERYTEAANQGTLAIAAVALMPDEE
jgi:integrase